MKTDRKLAFSGTSAVLRFPGNESSAVVPGSGFNGDTTRTAVDGGGSYNQAGDSTAIAWWTEHPIQVAGSDYGDTLEIGVVADHYNGIDKVGFIADDGTEVFVATPTTVDNIEQYRVTLDMSSKTAGDTVEVRAIAYPNHGVPRILQGDLQIDVSVADTNKQGFYSLRCTKISSVQTTAVSAGTSLVDAVNNIGSTVGSTIQHRLLFDEGDFLVRGSVNMSATKNTDIPILIEGSGTRGTYLDSDDTLGGYFNEGSYHVKNFTWYCTTVTIRPSASSNRPTYFFMENCDVTADVEPVEDGWVHTDPDSNSITIVSNPENDAVSRLFYERAYREHGHAAKTTSSAVDDCKGIWLEQCNISWELGTAVNWIKNCTSTNNLYDSFHGGCMLNLDIFSAQYGTNKPYILLPSTYVWEANTAFADDVVVLVEEDPNTWVMLKNQTGSPIPGEASFDRSDGWTDNQYPHNDGWQPRPKEDNTLTFENIWLQGLTTDNDSALQPMLYRESETLKDCVWKDWHITNTTQFSSNLVAQLYTHMDHWLMDNCVWWEDGASSSSRSGELRILWEDPDTDNTDRGWGRTQLNGSTIGCQNAKWTNSEVRGLVITNNWPTPVPTNMTEFETFINNQGGWDIAIDTYTKNNSPF